MDPMFHIVEILEGDGRSIIELLIILRIGLVFIIFIKFFVMVLV